MDLSEFDPEDGLLHLIGDDWQTVWMKELFDGCLSSDRTVAQAVLTYYNACGSEEKRLIKEFWEYLVQKESRHPGIGGSPENK